MAVRGLLVLQHLIGEHADLVVFEQFARLLVPPPRSMLHYMLAVALRAILLPPAQLAVGMTSLAEIVDRRLGEHLVRRRYIIFVAAVLIRGPVAILAAHLVLGMHGA